MPNHYSLVTGLYPGRHGVIANVIHDPATGRVTNAPEAKPSTIALIRSLESRSPGS